MQHKILYVEDDFHNFLLVQRILEAFPNVKLIRAKSASEGLELSSQVHPQLILMDIHLPGMDGLEMTRKLKGDETLKHIPVVALTANVMRGERERALEAGCAEFIPKPFNLQGFRQLVSKYLGLNQLDR